VLLLGGELLARRGMPGSGEALFARARVLLERLGDDRSAEAWGATGRLLRVAGDVDGAARAFEAALAGYDTARNVVGRAETLLELAQVRRGNEAVVPMLDLALQMARDAGRGELCARILIARSTLLEDDQTAREALQAALEHALDVGARVLAGMALVALGSRGVEDAERALIAGSQVLLDAEHYPALGLGLLRVAQHAERSGDSDLAMAAIEAAWRVFRSTDPGEGVGAVLRVAESLFTHQRAVRSLLVTVFARAALVGRRDPHALVVRDWYANRAPPAMVARLASSARDQLLADARRAVQSAVLPSLRKFGLQASSFDTAQGAIDVLGVLAGVSPRASARQLAPLLNQPVPDALPEAELPAEIEAAFSVTTVARVTVNTDATPYVGVTRSPIYDPDGRLAAMVRSGLSTASDLLELPTRPADDAGEDSFPDDGGFLTWEGGRPTDDNATRAWLGVAEETGSRQRDRRQRARGERDEEVTEEIPAPAPPPPPPFERPVTVAAAEGTRWGIRSGDDEESPTYVVPERRASGPEDDDG
jgi:hypothetical protein